MNTMFFNKIAQIDFTGVLQLNIAKGTGDNLIVSVLLQNEACGDDAKNLIPPLTLRGTAEELDNGFLEQISKPIQQVSSLMVDMEQFQKQLEEVKKQSAMNKVTSDKAKTATTEKDRKYLDSIRKSEELEKQGKYRAAWSALPEPSSLQEQQANEVRKRRSMLAAQFEPDLFAVPMETSTTTPNEEILSDDSIQDTIDALYQESDELNDMEQELEENNDDDNEEESNEENY